MSSLVLEAFRKRHEDDDEEEEEEKQQHHKMRLKHEYDIYVN